MTDKTDSQIRHRLNFTHKTMLLATARYRAARDLYDADDSAYMMIVERFIRAHQTGRITGVAAGRYDRLYVQTANARRLASLTLRTEARDEERAATRAHDRAIEAATTHTGWAE